MVDRHGIRVRLLGLVPIGFFLAHFYYYWTHGGVGHMLWMCNLATAVLGIGMIVGFAPLIRLAVIWLIPGLGLWFWFVVMEGGWLWTSFFSHVGGLSIGLLALREVGAGRWTWLYSTIWYVAVQQLCRMVTDPELNVNVAHRPYEGFEGMAYREYWILTTLLVVVGAWLTGMTLLKLFPAHR